MSRPVRDLIQPPAELAAPIDHRPEAAVRGPFIEKQPELLASARAPLQAMCDLSGKLHEAAARVRDRAALAREAAPTMERVTRQLDALVADLTSRREALERQIISTITPPARDEIAAEVRAHFKSRKDAFAEIVALVRGGDARTTAAVLSAQPFLSGMTPEQQDVIRQAARTKFVPEQHGLSEDLGRCLDRVRAAGAAFVVRVGGELHKWQQPDREVAAIKQGLEANAQ